MLDLRPQVFGSAVRTRVLTAIGALEETYATELARTLDIPLRSVQRIVEALETEGIVATRLVGNQRRITLNPRWLGAAELRALLDRLMLADADLQRRLGALRRRPRRKGKPL
ncbi:ArsR family transcriptional regulator [bacterium]|nr:MAG: ArsR family transcriptional regulator [bacterium]